VIVNGKTYAATVLADGTWTAAIPAADVSADSNRRQIDLHVVADGDRVACRAISLDLHGDRACAGLAAGAALSVIVNGKTYAATVLADGTWTAAIPAAWLMETGLPAALFPSTFTVTVPAPSALTSAAGMAARSIWRRLLSALTRLPPTT
jgi:hypothetical protein